MSSLSETMVKLSFFLANNRIDAERLFLMVLQKGRHLFPQNPRLGSSPLSLFFRMGKGTKLRLHMTRWPGVTLSAFWPKPRDFLYLPSPCRKRLPTEIRLLLTCDRWFACSMNSFLCECDLLDDNTSSLIATSLKRAHRVYEAKK